MRPTVDTQQYLEQVCAQIRWKRAHKVVRKELEDHIEDQQEVFAASGMELDIAAQRAIEEMGDPVEVGAMLDCSYRPQPAWSIIGLTVILMLLGYLSRIYIISQTPEFPTEHPLHGLLWLLLAVAALVVGYFLDFTLLVRHRKAVCIGYGALLLLAGIQVADYGSLSYMYSNYLMLFFPIVFSAVLCSSMEKGCVAFVRDYCCIGAIVLYGLYLPRFGTVLICWATGAILLTVALAKGRYRINKWAGISALYVPPVLLLLWLLSHPGFRNTMWLILHPELEPLGAGYVNFRAREILSGAQLFGTGSFAGEGRLMPDVVTDYALTFLSHRLGIAAFIGLIALFVLFFGLLVVFILQQKNQFGQLVALGVFLILLTQFAIYVMNNLGYAVLGSMTLPLVSYGNASLVLNALLVGVMLSVFRTGHLVPDRKSLAHI